jgi:putative phosphoesterase
MQAVVDPLFTKPILKLMKIGIISDVHGDLKALEHAITLLEARHRVKAIWCAGDLVGRGKQPNEVVSRVLARRIPTVMGNHDEMMLTHQRNEWGQTVMLGQVLGYNLPTLQRLTKLPRTYRDHIEGHTLVMVHGSPRSNTESISLNPLERGRALDWLDKIGADILIAGHTHTPMILQDYRGLIVNPGSLFDPTGFQRSSSETYGVLDVSTMGFEYYPLWG